MCDQPGLKLEAKALLTSFVEQNAFDHRTHPDQDVWFAEVILCLDGLLQPQKIIVPVSTADGIRWGQAFKDNKGDFSHIPFVLSLVETCDVEGVGRLDY